MSNYKEQFPLPKRPQDGLCINYTSVPGVFTTAAGSPDLLRQGGYKWARQWVYRSDVQNTTTGVYDWGILDEFVGDLTDAGFRIMFVLVDNIDGSGGSTALLTASAIQHFADFCAEVAKRYARLGAIFELWNEPDDGAQRWGGGTADGVEYSAMAMACCAAIRAAVGEDAYIAGPACDIRNVGTFLQKCFDAGLGRFWDMVTVHTYRFTVPPETIKAGLRQIRLIAGGKSARNIQIGISETAYPSTTFEASPDRIFRGTDYVKSTAAPTGSISAATNATPIVITTTTPHGLKTGDLVTIASVGGNTNANNTWYIDVTGASTFSLVGSAGNSNYTSGGTYAAATCKNLLQWSEDLTNAIWLGDSSSFVKTRCEPPLQLPGAVAWNLSRTGISGDVGIRQSAGGISVKNGYTYCISAWMRCVSGTHDVFFNMMDLSRVDEIAWNEKFRLTTEWMRYDHSFAVANGNTPQKFRITSSNTPDQTPDIQVCNLQLEQLCVGKTISDAGFRALQLERQADNLIAQFKAAASEGVCFFGVYTVRDFNPSAAVPGVADGLNHYGVLDYYGVPKPAYTKFKTLIETMG